MAVAPRTTMGDSTSTIVARQLARALVALVVAQFYTAGLANFGAASFRPHAVLGMLALAVSLGLVVAAVVGRRTLHAIGPSLACFVLSFLQPVLVFIARPRAPFVAALHPVVGLAIGLLAWWIASGTRRIAEWGNGVRLPIEK